MSTARRLQRKQPPNSAKQALEHLQALQGSLNGLPSLVEDLKDLHQELEQVLQDQENLSAKIAAWESVMAQVLPYLNLPVDVQASVEETLKIP